MIDNGTVGKTIAALRQQANLSQQGLANLCSVTHQAVSKWENGQALPDMQTLLFLSKYFEVSMEDILMGNLPALTEAASEKLSEEAETEIRTEVETAVAEAIAEAEDEIRAEVERAMAEALEEDFEEAMSAACGKEYREAMAAAENVEGKRASSLEWKQIHDLAPFASRGTIEQLVREKVESGEEVSWDRVFHLLPFCSRSLADYLLDKLDTGKLDWKNARKIMTHASRDRVDQLFEKFLGEMDVEKLTQIAPFVSRQFIAECLRSMDDFDEDQVMRRLLPFLPRDLVDELILKKMGKTTVNGNEKTGFPVDWSELLTMVADMDENRARRYMEKILAREGIKNMDWGMLMAFTSYADEEILSRMADQLLRQGKMNDMNWGMLIGFTSYLNEEILSRLTKWMIKNRGTQGLEKGMTGTLLPYINEDAKGTLHDALFPEEPKPNGKKPDRKERLLMRIARKAVEEGNEEWLEEHGDELTQEELEVILPMAAKKQMWGALEELWEHADDATLQYLIHAAIEQKNWELLEELQEHANDANLGNIAKAAMTAKQWELLEELQEYLDDSSLAAAAKAASDARQWDLVEEMLDRLDQDTLQTVLEAAMADSNWDMIDEIKEYLDEE